MQAKVKMGVKNDVTSRNSLARYLTLTSYRIDKKLTKKEIEFGVEPKYPNTSTLYQKFILPINCKKEQLPLKNRIIGFFGWTFVSSIMTIFRKFTMNIEYFGEFNQLYKFTKTPMDKRTHKVLTCTNHISTIDDPLITVLNSHYSAFIDSTKLPWATAGHNILFATKFKNWFFSYGRAGPLIRGNGIYQPTMDFFSNRIKFERGFYINFFVEGKVNMFKEKLPLKWGAARMIIEMVEENIKKSEIKVSAAPKITLIYHIGLDNCISPFRKENSFFGYFPDLSKIHNITINVSEPLDFSILLYTMRKRRLKRPELANFQPRSLHDYKDLNLCEERQVIMDIINLKMDKLKIATEIIHKERGESKSRFIYKIFGKDTGLKK